MAHNKRHVFTNLNGTLSIIECNCEDDDLSVPERVAKALFEASRATMVNPALVGEALVQWQMNVHYSDYQGPITGMIATEIDIKDIPANDTFRDAWVFTGRTIEVNMPKARDIHLYRIRRIRDASLAELDMPFMKALEKGDTAAQGQVAAQKQVLRDIPQNFDLSVHKTPEALDAAWPDGLPRNIGT